jgi:predicted SAM-dependent methyltransferase
MAEEIINNAKREFEKYMKKWTIRDNRFTNGLDVGCGTCRIDDMIPSIDQQGDYRYAHSQFVWNCINLDLFNDNVLDFIFSSHCLEDFEDIGGVFHNWWRKLKPNGLMLLLLPDMEGGRYPKVEQGGNPSHRVNTGKNFILTMLETLKDKDMIEYEVLQCDTIPHNESSSIDFVIRKHR